ncbi:MAG: radical SAM protein [Phycisphaerae bacterium]|nr:radical SAM protein [Phycisphaerae bacterium]NIR68218.1 radical SAM protein [candidate division Zixibacteria bacterium]NIP55929.1 radical SAM protein [Phycisphaerae bacterium]NIS54495.1 radical SAM protein [Phycisphaerae bacterium]NIU12130.1 radical SAM protein [Phycisphaerae bacterium]
MTRLAEKDYTYFSTVRGMCRQCRRIVPARIFFQNEQVWQESLCPDCENEAALIASDKNWYLANVLKPMPDHSPLYGSKPPEQGCPLDCGPCTWHASSCQLPVISITNACNLGCPICFTYNRADSIYNMSVREMIKTIDWIVESSGKVDLINITGGEPTLHPEIIDILTVCKRPEIGRVTMNSNGIILSENYGLCEKLAELGIYVILSFNTFESDVSRKLHGRDVTELKLRAISNLSRAGVKITLLNVMVNETNEDSIAGILDLMRQNDNILSLTVQTMTYTGQGGSKYVRTQRVPVDLAVKKICEQSGEVLEFDDFITRPSAHPLCYLLCYMLKAGNDFIPFARFAPHDKVRSLTRNSYLIRPENGEEFFKDVINQLFSEGKTEYLSVLRELVDKMYPPKKALTDFERQRIAESAVRTIYVHAHMDEDTFDCSRAMLCPDLVPSEPGLLIPACTYNLFYRMKDDRFYAEEAG